MVRNNHIGMRRTTACAVDEAFIREKRAEATSTLARGRRKVGTVDAEPADAKRIKVAVG